MGAIYREDMVRKTCVKINYPLPYQVHNLYFCLKQATLNLTIHTKSLFKSYKGRTVVRDVSVDVQQGEIVGLLGPNGAGKTTTFYMVVGLIKPDQGTVYLNDQNITRLPMYKRA